MSLDYDTLDHIIYGKTEPGATPGVLGVSGKLTPDDVAIWQGLAALDPMPTEGERQSEAVGVYKGPDANFIMVRAMLREGDPHLPLYQYILMPREVWQMLAGNINVLDEVVHEPIPYASLNGSLPPLRVPPFPTWTADKRILLFSKLLDQISDDGNMDILFHLLGAALHENQLQIRGFSPILEHRLNLVQALMLLLPSPARLQLTFATYVEQVASSIAMLVFSDDQSETARLAVDFSDDQPVTAADLPSLPYVERLRELWHGDVKSFVADLRAMELMAVHMMNGKPLLDGLNEVAQRLAFDSAVMKGEAIPPDALKAVMRGVEPSPALLLPYAEQLLDVALAERDSEAVGLLSTYMAKHADVDALISQRLEERLTEEPDAVYYFVRTLLSQREDVEERWLPLLHSAAVVSLSIVLQQQADAETVMTWLKLIAREPVAYQLSSVLRNGMMAAKTLAHEDGMLGRRLFVFASKRMPDLLPTMLNDQQMMAVMEEPIGPALRTFAPESVNAAIETGREVSLVLLSRAVDEAPQDPNAAQVFTPSRMDYLWGLRTMEQFPNLAESMQPAAIIDRLITEGAAWLSRESTKTLLKRALVAEDGPLFVRICTELIAPEQRQQFIEDSFQVSNLTTGTILVMTRLLQEQEIITPQQGVDLLLQAAETRDWAVESTRDLVEQAARMLQQNQSLVAPAADLLRVLEILAASRAELALRAVLRRLTAYIETLEDESAQVTYIQQINQQVAWSNAVRNQLMAWWRDYARRLPPTRLQQMDKALEGKKSLERARSVVQTALAVRKMLGKRSLDEFADAIGTAYSVLQAFFDSFDGKQQFEFEALTVREELEARGAELTPDERSVLAKNLKELAELVTQLADNRSKSTLIRREEDIERQLLSGDQQPHGAIDTIRWLSGYLSGLQDDKG
ncbi:MAG: hypothetical protein ACOCX3_00300 [Chloroflexota bacterium]